MSISKIKTQDDIDKSNRKKQFLIGGILIVLLVVSTVGYSLLNRGKTGDSDSKINYNGLEFFRVAEDWRVQIDDAVFQFSYLPAEVENITVEGNYSLASYAGQVVYFNDYGEGADEIIINFERFLRRYQKACYVNETCEEDLPVKDCNDNFIIFKEGENFVHRDNNCVFIVGDSLRGADAFIYKVLKIN